MARARRKRAPFPWWALLWSALAANVVAGILYSPATAASRVRVVGAPAGTESPIRALLQDLRGRPSAGVNRVVVESAVEALGPVKSARFELNLLGRGLLTITPKKAVARVPARPGLFLSDEGELFRAAPSTEPMPALTVPKQALEPGATLAGPWEPGKVAELCQALAELGPDWSVAVDARGALSARQRGRALVLLGSSESMDQKIALLRRAMERTPDVFKSAKVVNLMSFTHPVIVPGVPQP